MSFFSNAHDFIINGSKDDASMADDPRVIADEAIARAHAAVAATAMLQDQACKLRFSFFFFRMI